MWAATSPRSKTVKKSNFHGQSAHSNANKHKEKKVMRNTLSILVAALMAVIFTGCAAEEGYEPVRLDITAIAEACTSATCADVRFCTTHVNDPDNKVNQSTSESCADMDLGTGEASASLPNVGVEGSYSLAFRGLPAGFHVKYDAGSGFVVDEVMYLHSGTNVLQAVIGPDITTPTGSGLGNVCLRAADEQDTHIDESTCTVKVDGAIVTGTTPPEGVTCEYMYLADLTAKVSNFDVVCPNNLEGSLNTEVVEDTVTDIGITLTDTTVVNPTTPTTLCLHLAVSNGDPVAKANCTVTDIAWKELTPVAPPTGVCEDTDALYFDEVKAGDRQIHVDCDEGDVLAFYTFVESVLNEKDVFFAPPGTPGDACYKDIGDNVNVLKMSLPLQAKLGHYASNGTTCVLEADSASYADWAVTGLSDGGSCTQVGDPACLIQAHGLAADPLVEGVWYAHLVWETTPAQLQTLQPDEKVVHFVTLEDADTKSVIVPVVVKNGEVQE